MVPRLLKTFSLFLLAALLWCGGCRREAAPPSPLAAEQIPAALQQAFAKAAPEAKELVGHITTALAGQDYSKAFYAIQALSSQSGLTKNQQSTLGRSLLTVNNLLQSAQAKGDADAAQTIKTYRTSK
jgi:hypothetical protein